MKKIFLLATAILLTATFVKAQSTDDPEMDYIKKAYSQDKKAIVNAYLNLDVDQGGKFWPVYADYQAAQQKLAQARFNTINTYVDSMSTTLTSKVADDLAIALLDNNVKLEKENRKYYRKTRKAIGALYAAKYIQLELYFQTMWKTAIQANVPVIGDISKEKTTSGN